MSWLCGVRNLTRECGGKEPVVVWLLREGRALLGALRSEWCLVRRGLMRLWSVRMEEVEM